MSAPCKHWLCVRGKCCKCGLYLKRVTVPTRVRDTNFPECRHWVAQRGFCCRCGEEVEEEDRKPFEYIAESAQLSHKYVTAMKKQKSGIGFGQRKLHLVLGLHHTLLDSCHITRLADGDKHLVEQVGVRDDLGRFIKGYACSDVLVKLRPFVHQFLREADELFVMHVYTNLSRSTSRSLVKMLDPLRIFFGHRVIVEEDTPDDHKTLGLVLAQERGVVIVDWVRPAWDPKDRRNLVQIKPYRYFKPNPLGTPKILLNLLKNKLFKVESDPEKKMPDDQSDQDTALMDLLKSLKDLHRRFFNGPSYDVRISAVDESSYVENNNLIPFDFLSKGLKLSPQYVGFMKRHVMIKTLQEKKKLHLVLGLRGTLYDYSRISHLSDREKHLIGEVHSRDDLWRITAQSHEGLIKLRPFVAEFLREANKLFTLHAYSLARPEHSDYMLKLLDPDQTYFGRRVICSRDTWMKTLDLVLVDERVLVVMDDQCSTWWTDHTNHLLQITSYRYFQRPTTTQHNGLIANLFNFLKANLLGYRCHHLAPKSSSEENIDETEEDGGLANALKFLRNLHQRFFDGEYQDVRMLLHT
ncbi:FCP1 homology domain [Arabidopsis thaliana x Arabidopsis arenosa]|uniref:protein-serine/threonine phosphatase n=1 Tax=Arabidopsis thaliana x Arabidopsis arenosa TaxID=1240361 RepID=A0A8T2AT29_9BRAS|nr:FCP1 homology domain [Arabidopsis thaliana x Arabidopsis arenosa]